MPSSNRPRRAGDVIHEPTRGAPGSTVQETPPGDAADVSTPRHLLGGLLAGIAAGCGMYAVLAVFALGQGRDVTYPLHAVHALLAGRRVLPDHPDSLYGAQLTDLFFGPLYFFLPAAAVGLFTAYRVGRRGAPSSWFAAVVPAAAATAVFFVLFVLIVALPEASRSMQRVSTGYGIRELGIVAWVVAHLVYVALLVALLGPLTRASAAVSRRRA